MTDHNNALGKNFTVPKLKLKYQAAPKVKPPVNVFKPRIK